MKYSIYLIRLKDKKGKYYIKIGITSTSVEDRIRRKHFQGKREYENGVPLYKYFEAYKIIGQTDYVFSFEEAAAIENDLADIINKPFWPDVPNLDGITELRSYTDSLKEKYEQLLNFTGCYSAFTSSKFTGCYSDKALSV